MIGEKTDPAGSQGGLSMPSQQKQIERARAVKQRHEAALLAHPGVVGVGIGLRQRGGELTNEVCIVVMVRRKRPSEELEAADELLPHMIDGVPVDVQEVGEIAAQ
jgi:hypothetical protein